MNYSYNFDDQLRMSEGVGREEDTEAFILSRFPNAIKVERASRSDDKNGTDYWIDMESGERESLDLKARKKDFSVNNPEKDDLALEVWSVLNNKVGWTRDTTKRTNWIMWKWDDTKRYMLLPFPWLCGVFEHNWQEWIKQYKAPIQNTVDKWGRIRWQSQCVFVPRQVLWNEMLSTYGGAPHSQPINLDTSQPKPTKRALSPKAQSIDEQLRKQLEHIDRCRRMQGRREDDD
jgi:hypothetical protein